MTRSVIASVLDTLAVGALGYGAFRFAVAVTPCQNQGSCPILTPLVLLSVLVAVAAYFLLGYALFRSTFGQRIAGQ